MALWLVRHSLFTFCCYSKVLESVACDGDLHRRKLYVRIVHHRLVVQVFIEDLERDGGGAQRRRPDEPHRTVFGLHDVLAGDDERVVRILVVRRIDEVPPDESELLGNRV